MVGSNKNERQSLWAPYQARFSVPDALFQWFWVRVKVQVKVQVKVKLQVGMRMRMRACLETIATRVPGG